MADLADDNGEVLERSLYAVAAAGEATVKHVKVKKLKRD